MTVIALDPGEKRTGVAVSDPSETVARPLRTISGGASSAAVGTIARIVEETGARAVVVGLPLRLDGGRGPQADRADSLADRLRSTLDIPVYTHDERYTTRMAATLHGDADSADRDSRAAAHLLSGWLEARG